MNVTKSSYMTLNPNNILMKQMDQLTSLRLFFRSNVRDDPYYYINIISNYIYNCNILIQKCKDDLELIYKDNSNSISQNKIKKIEELKNNYFINMELSMPNNLVESDPRKSFLKKYNSLEKNTKEKYGEVLSSNNYIKDENYFKKFYKPKKGLLWGDSSKNYVIKNNNTLVYLVNRVLCELLIKECIISIEKKKKIFENREEELIKIGEKKNKEEYTDSKREMMENPQLNKKKYDLLPNKCQKFFKKNGNIFIKKTNLEMYNELPNVIKAPPLNIDIDKIDLRIQNEKHDTDFSDFNLFYIFLNKFYDEKKITIQYQHQHPGASRIINRVYHKMIYTKKPRENIIL